MDTSPSLNPGSHDGIGAGDHDQAFRWGRRYNTETPFPFTTQQYGRLLLLRSRVQAGLYASDDAHRGVEL